MTAPTPKPILLVEDDFDDIELTRIGLQQHHLMSRLVVARDGAEALELLLGEHALEFAFVLLDLKLPKVGGFEVLERVRADPRTETLPVVILTSSIEQKDMLRGYRGGANAFVRKPVAFDEFCTTVAALGLFWDAVNHVPASASPLTAV